MNMEKEAYKREKELQDTKTSFYTIESNGVAEWVFLRFEFKKIQWFLFLNTFTLISALDWRGGLVMNRNK